ncbi:hypothetical protein BHE74_00028758, partial [Ensete ventricosum]
GGRPRPAPLQRRLIAAKAFCGGSGLQKAVVMPAANPTANRSDSTDRKGGHPLAGQLPTERGHRCQRRSDGAKAQ